MNTRIFYSTLLLSLCTLLKLHAEGVGISNTRPLVSVVRRDADSCVTELARSITNRQGRIVSLTNHYTTIATGMNVQAADGSWAPASSEIEVNSAGGAIGKKTRHMLQFSSDITDATGPVRFTVGGKLFRTKPLCISYWDSATGKSVLIAEFRSTTATLAQGDNKIVWKDCATDFKCNLIIENQLAGMDQCLEILEQPPAPSEFGLNDQTTRLQLITEFFNPPAATKHTIKKDGIADDGFLDFGNAIMPPGKAFKVADSKAVHVVKHWAKLDGRDCLIEEVPYAAIQKYLKTLPQHPTAAVHKGAATKRIASIQVVKQWYASKGFAVPTNILILSTNSNVWVAVVNPNSVNEMGFQVDPKKKVIINVSGE